MCEAIVEDPTAVLLRQLDEKKKTKLMELKAEGVEYEERMAELEKIDIDRPLADFLEMEITAAVAKWPWLAVGELRPKSVARMIFERALTFQEYVRELGLERSEGVLLRYLSDAYKALKQTVPANSKTEALLELEDWLGTLVRGVDASLLDEWERLRLASEAGPSELAAPTAEVEPQVRDVTRDVRGFTVMVRNAAFRLVQLLSRRRYDEVATSVRGPDGRAWTGEAIAAQMAPFWDEHTALDASPAARAPDLVAIEHDEAAWIVRQTLLDVDEARTFVLRLRVLLESSRDEGAPVLELVEIGR